MCQASLSKSNPELVEVYICMSCYDSIEMCQLITVVDAVHDRATSNW